MIRRRKVEGSPEDMGIGSWCLALFVSTNEKLHKCGEQEVYGMDSQTCLQEFNSRDQAPLT